jgi:hypothetical protein
LNAAKLDFVDAPKLPLPGDIGAARRWRRVARGLDSKRAPIYRFAAIRP